MKSVVDLRASELNFIGNKAYFEKVSDVFSKNLSEK